MNEIDLRDEESPGPAVQCSVGIMAYNEEGNIASAINAILEYPPESAQLVEVIVVASGCTDRTPEIVAALARDDERIRLVVQKERAGKAAAINLFVAAARSPIVVMVNGDNIVRPGAIDALLSHFGDEAVGMVGGHPVPVNDDDTFLGYAVHLQWRLHDAIARESPKMGEIVAFRNIVHCIPNDTPVDELSIQAVVTAMGFRLVYEPRAIVYNLGPATLADFLRQRRRISAGHHRVAKQQGYSASTMSVTRIARAFVRCHAFRTARSKSWVAGAISLEVAGRVLGYYDFVRRRQHHVWHAIATTKDDVTQGIDNWARRQEGRIMPSAGRVAVGIGRTTSLTTDIADPETEAP